MSFKHFYLTEAAKKADVIKYLNKDENSKGAMEEVHLYMPGLKFFPDGGKQKIAEARAGYKNKTALPRVFDPSFAPSWFWFEDPKKTTEPILRFTENVKDKVGKKLFRGHYLYFIGQTLGNDVKASRADNGYLTGYELDEAEKYGFDDVGEKYADNFLVTKPNNGAVKAWHIGDDEPQVIFKSDESMVDYIGVKTSSGYDLFDKNGKLNSFKTFKDIVNKIKSLYN